MTESGLWFLTGWVGGLATVLSLSLCFAISPMQQLWCGLAGFSYLTFSLLAKVDVRHYFICLYAVAKADLAWCNCFFQSWHGAAFVVSGSSPVVHVHSDASGSFGCGAVSDNCRWLQVPWPESWADVSTVNVEIFEGLIFRSLAACCKNLNFRPD